MSKLFELVVPAYNESKNLRQVIERAIQAAQQQSLTPQDFTLVVVENGSTDDSKAVLEQLSQTNLGNWFRVVQVFKNQGYGFGIWSGLQQTNAEFVGWTHADQQCDPLDAIKAMRIVQETSGKKLLVKGERCERHPRDKFVSRVFETIARIVLGLKVYEINAQPKVFSKGLLNLLKEPPLTFAFDLYVLYNAKKAGYEFEPLQVRFPPRIHGTSKWAATFFGRYKTILGMIKYMFHLAGREGRI